MTTMIERVALALHEADQTAPTATVYEDHLKLMARAAIAAMREPTEEMVEHTKSMTLVEEHCLVWQAMIDAALNER